MIEAFISLKKAKKYIITKLIHLLLRLESKNRFKHTQR